MVLQGHPPMHAPCQQHVADGLTVSAKGWDEDNTAGYHKDRIFQHKTRNKNSCFPQTTCCVNADTRGTGPVTSQSIGLYPLGR